MKSSGIKFIKYLTEAPSPKGQNYKSFKNTKHLEPFILTLNPDFEKEVKNIRNAFDIDLSETTEDEKETEKRIVSFMEDVELNNKVNELRKKFKLQKQWHDMLMDYVVCDETLPSYYIGGLKLEIDEKKECKLILTKETTLKEIIMAWPQIEKELGKNNKRNKPWKKFWRDYDIYKMAEEGKSINEISKLINQRYGDNLDYGNIKKIESSFRKKVGISKIPRKNKLKTINKNYL